jgi:hypothetical protein
MRWSRANMSGACEYGISTLADFSRHKCDCAPIFPEGVAVRPEEVNKFVRPLLACVVLRASAPIEALLL